MLYANAMFLLLQCACFIFEMIIITYVGKEGVLVGAMWSQTCWVDDHRYLIY